MDKSKQKRGRPKGSTSFIELSLEELAKLFKAGDKIKVSRLQLDSLKASSIKPTETKDNGF